MKKTLLKRSLKLNVGSYQLKDNPSLSAFAMLWTGVKVNMTSKFNIVVGLEQINGINYL